MIWSSEEVKNLEWVGFLFANSLFDVFLVNCFLWYLGPDAS